MILDETRLRERGYLQAQANETDFLGLWPGWIHARALLLATTETLTEEQAHWRPASTGGEVWNAVQVVQHVTGWTENIVDVGEALATGRPAHKNPSGFLEAERTQSLADARNDLVRASMRLTAFMADSSWEVNLEATTDHPTFGPMNIRGWLLRCRFHDVEHTGQIRNLLTAPGFPAGDSR